MKKIKLDLDTLKKEMELVSNEEMLQSKGGYGGPGDCMFQAIAFATGQSVDSVQMAYANHMYGSYSNLSPGDRYYLAGQMGVTSQSSLSWLQQQYGLSSGYSPSAPAGYSSLTSTGVILLDQNGDGVLDHAANVTGHDGNGGLYIYDAQSGSTYTMSSNDPRISGAYTAYH